MPVLTPLNADWKTHDTVFTAIAAYEPFNSNGSARRTCSGAMPARRAMRVDPMIALHDEESLQLAASSSSSSCCLCSSA